MFTQINSNMPLKTTPNTEYALYNYNPNQYLSGTFTNVQKTGSGKDKGCTAKLRVLVCQKFLDKGFYLFPYPAP